MSKHDQFGDFLTIVFGMVAVAIAVFAVISILKVDMAALFLS